MKRSRLAQRTPLRRKTRLAPANRERRTELYAQQYGQRGELIRAMPCLLLGQDGCHGPIEAAHVRSRGAGGTARDLVPLCAAHHREQHAHGVKTFQQKHDIDLRAAADALARKLDTFEGGTHVER